MGSQREDERDKFLVDYIAAIYLVMINTGKSLTCVRHNGSSYIDLTITITGLAPHTKDWQVLQVETLSDPKYISNHLFHKGMN